MREKIAVGAVVLLVVCLGRADAYVLEFESYTGSVEAWAANTGTVSGPTYATTGLSTAENFADPGGSPGPVEASALLTENDTLSGEDVLPGFAVPVRRFFAP